MCIHTPKVSVLIPVYNTPEKYLREAIESILVQTFKDFELILVNDGSTNNAEEVILSYVDPRIVYVKNNDNLQLIQTLNKGLGLCRGEYIARFDSDDISLPSRLEKQVNFLDTDKEIGVVGSWYERIPTRDEWQAPSGDLEIKTDLLFFGCVLAHPSVMFRRSLNIQYSSEYLHCEDYALWLDLIDRTKFATIPESLIRYRCHGGSISTLYADIQQENAQHARYAAQRKYYGGRDESIVGKLVAQDLVSWNEFQELLSFLILMGNWAYLHRQKYKKILFKTQGGREYLSFLWKGEMNRRMKIHLRHKLLNTWRVCVADKIKGVFTSS